MGESSQTVNHGDIHELMESAAFLCCLTNARVDLVLNNITDTYVTLLTGKGQNCGGAR